MRLQVSMLEPWTWVYPGDEAIDRTRDDWPSELEAANESGNADRLPLKAGAKPALWELSHLRGRARRMATMLSFSDDAEDRLRGTYLAAAFGLLSVENLYDQSGSPVKIERFMDPGLERLQRVMDPTMDLLCEIDDGLLVSAIGGTILRKALLSKKK